MVEAAGTIGVVAEDQPPFEKPTLLTAAQLDVLRAVVDGSSGTVDDVVETAAHPDFLNPPPEEDGSASLSVLPHPPFFSSETVAREADAGTTAPREVLSGAAASFIPDAAASRLSSFSSRFLSFSRAFELSLGRCAASISLNRYVSNVVSREGNLGYSGTMHAHRPVYECEHSFEYVRHTE